MLAWTIYISFIGAAVLMLRPRASARTSRIVALVASIATLALVILATIRFTPGSLLTVTKVPWIPSLGIEYHLAVDGISLVVLLLTGIVGVAGVLFSWNIDRRPAEFFALYLALIGAVYGVFLSFDLFLFFVFYELAIIPKYFLIAIWGSTRREYAAMKLALYSFAGSAMVLIGIIATLVETGGKTLNLVELARYPFPLHFEMWVFPLVFVGFAILAGMWPFHTWAPTGHVAAPTAASMLLAGVIMKLGAYGCLRVAMMLFPAGMGAWSFHVLGLSSWRNLFAVLALIGIVYGASVALVQRDFKFVIGYSSVSHMGFVLLGLMTLTQTGLGGAVVQMFSHAVIASLLFAVVGRMVYDRTHTRFLNELAPMRLAHAIPFAAFTFVIAAMASIGLPGFSGFIAEFEIIIGTWHAWPILAVLAAVGILVGIGFTWRAMDKAFFGGGATAEPQSAGEHPALPPNGGSTVVGTTASALPPITVPEKIAALILIASTVVVGVYPRLLLDLNIPALNSPLFDGLRKGAWR